MRIYVASSWRNSYQQQVVEDLRVAGHEVYDFRNPPNKAGFAWSSIDPNWESWTTEQYRQALSHPLSEAGYRSDMDGMMWAEACVLVLPCGRSAHAEAGWFAGAGKPVIAYIPTRCEPELMYGMFTGITESITETLEELDRIANLRQGQDHRPLRRKIASIMETYLGVADDGLESYVTNIKKTAKRIEILLQKEASSHRVACMLNVLQSYEQWEADIISDNRCWEPEGFATDPTIVQPHWNRLMEIQQLRNAALSGCKQEDQS
jgi:hypothetical protein